MSRCDELWCLTLDGWDKSVGVRAEVELARTLGKPVALLCPQTLSLQYETVQYEVTR